MISVCIPVYNIDVRPLVEQLQQEISGLDNSVEIVIIDDASRHEVKHINRELKPYCSQYIELEHNIGRSRIRNLFLKHTTQPYLLFLDCDGLILDAHFLQRYISCIEKKNSPVVVGGRTYGDKPTDPQKILRWKFGIERESKPVSIRQLNPSKSFMTNNFVIAKNVLEKIPFDESIAQYGHEDTLLGYALEKAGIPITHIHNPVWNNDLETAVVFLDKTHQGLVNLFQISQKMHHNENFVKQVRSLRVWKKTRKIQGVYQFFYGFISKKIENNLHSANPSMKAFDLYKLHHLYKISVESVIS